MGMQQHAMVLCVNKQVCLSYREFPGELEKIMVWFRDYKTPDGKPQNSYGYGGKCMNKEFALKVIAETHEAYKALKSGSRANTEELALV